MTIIHRQLLLTFLRYLVMALVGSLILFTLIDLLDHMGSLVDNAATAGEVVRYYLYKAAWTLDIVLPISMLMATLFSVGQMARYLELTALFAAGWSLFRVTRPLVVAAALVSLLSLGWREYVLPKANVARERVWEVDIHGRPETIRPTQNIALTGPDGRLYYARRYDPATNQLTGLKIVTREGSRVTERIDAARAEWDGEHWTLVDGTRRVFDGELERLDAFTRLTAADLTITPRAFEKDRVAQEDMNIRQLREHVVLVRQTGGDPRSAEVDLQFNLAFPLVNLIVVLLGVVLASGPRKTTVASGFGLTIGISFGYYLFMNFGRALGHAGAIPPLPAAWAGNVFYGLLFLMLFARARR
jgi:lipopolysaccharide export system permease protein